MTLCVRRGEDQRIAASRCVESLRLKLEIKRIIPFNNRFLQG